MRRQHGAALLAAMLTVTLVATFAAAALWQQWRSVEVEAAERARIQAAWVLVGGLDWARLVLREDRRVPDHLGEPWAVPLEEARLSSFLAADQNNTADTGPEVLDAFLSGQIVDQQSLLNVRSLVDGDKVSQDDLDRFRRLFEQLGLPGGQLELLAENLRFALDRSADNRSSPQAPLLPQRVEQLVWLGLPLETVAALQPYVTVLPSAETSVNLNTASAEVIHAAVLGLSMADAQRLVTMRESAPFNTVEDAERAIGAGAGALGTERANVGVVSSFFEIRSRLRLGQHVIEERALVQKAGLRVSVLQRVRGPVPVQTVAEPANR
jgi:general secretion pathway protein K